MDFRDKIIKAIGAKPDASDVKVLKCVKLLVRMASSVAHDWPVVATELAQLRELRSTLLDVTQMEKDASDEALINIVEWLVHAAEKESLSTAKPSPPAAKSVN